MHGGEFHAMKRPLPAAAGVYSRPKRGCMRISIITLAIDAPEYFHEAVASIARQEHEGLEHIVVHDGDETFPADLRRRYPAIKVLKGRRAGATAAAALGVEAATGDFILFLHSDDRLYPGALARLAVAAAARPEVRIWTGGARIFRTLADGREVTVRRLVGRHMTRLSLDNVCDNIPLLSARFCHRSVFSQIGNFDPRFSESSDREFLLRAAVAGVTEASLDVMASEMRLHEGSRTIHHRRDGVPPYLVEHIAIAEMLSGRPDIDPYTRRFLRNWRAREKLRLFVHQCRERHWKDAGALLLGAGLMDPLWFFRIMTVFAAQQRRSGRYDSGA
jgi:glycosyltransferase involved in cell wall biosynthesis